MDFHYVCRCRGDDDSEDDGNVGDDGNIWKDVWRSALARALTVHGIHRNFGPGSSSHPFVEVSLSFL